MKENKSKRNQSQILRKYGSTSRVIKEAIG